ncbi:MAG: metal-dependent hydrolase [Methanoregula sp.]|nr:metal-dependent hydrolase [Methanoregula sp.]
MYFFFHLIAGIILGVLISDFLKDQRWLIPCAIGAVLPDLIDKPIGYLLFPATIGSGRIYTHTLLIAIIIMALGIAIWKIKNDPGVMAFGVGILSHQVLDLMWREPLNWYFPLLGQFKGKITQEYFFTLLFRDLNQPFEQILILMLCAILVAVLCRHKLPAIINRNYPVFPAIGTACAFLLCILSGIIIGRGILNKSFPELGWSRPEELILGGIIIALAALLIWRWQKKARIELRTD